MLLGRWLTSDRDWLGLLLLGLVFVLMLVLVLDVGWVLLVVLGDLLASLRASSRCS
ncbi:hypothetical protein ACWDWO_26880 [Actinopolymorpha singaporensis]